MDEENLKELELRRIEVDTGLRQEAILLATAYIGFR